MAAEQLPAASFTFNFEEALRATFRDPDWFKKLALGSLFGLLGIVIIGSIIVQGYLLTYSERVARGEPRPLPEWENYGELLRKGFFGFVVAFVYALPIAVVGFGLGALIIPLVIVGNASNVSPDAIVGVVLLAVCGLLLLILPLVFLILVISPAAQAQLVLHDHDLGSAFRFGEVLGLIRRHLGQYLLMTVLVLAALTVLSQIGQFACYIGVFATTFIAQLFQYHLLGQLCWHERVSRGIAPSRPVLP